MVVHSVGLRRHNNRTHKDTILMLLDIEQIIRIMFRNANAQIMFGSPDRGKNSQIQ